MAIATARSGNSEIDVMNPDGSAPVDLTNDPSSDIQPSWSPDGTKIAFASNRTGLYQIFMMNADGTGVADLSNDSASDFTPAWSPDGTRIAFTSNRTGANQIWVMNADGTGQVNLSASTAKDSQPRWSPDGTMIAFTRVVGTTSQVFDMNADGSAQTNRSNSLTLDSDPAWSPTGTAIAFTRKSSTSQIYVMNPDGSNQVNLTNNTAKESQPAWSPDGGTRILFTQGLGANGEIYVMNANGSDQTNITHSVGSDTAASWQPLPAQPAVVTPIQHVVVLYQENHSFDNVLGEFCVQLARCDGATTGQLANGSTIALSAATDLVPFTAHDGTSQTNAINGGAMNGFSLNTGCDQSTNYACYTQFSQSGIPELWSLASTYAVSDRTFELDTVPSWQAHLELVSSDLDGFTRSTNPVGGGGAGPGWGCDSLKTASWQATQWNKVARQPSCIPAPDGSGPFRTSPVPWVPTIMDRLDGAGLSWNIYAGGSNAGILSYGWAICPTFSDCLNTAQDQHVKVPDQFAADAAAGTLGALSIVMPLGQDSQHNFDSMLQGDNWIADQVSAVMNGPDWSSTAIFITYDDCGCFYDHVAPPAGYGIRVPMVIVSPYAKAAFTDSNVASFTSILAYAEHVFGLAPLSSRDATAYDFSANFDYTQAPRAPIALVTHRVPSWELRWIRDHPADPSDPT